MAGHRWDEGPCSVADQLKIFLQKNRIDTYESYINQLENLQLTFACSCSREKIALKADNAQYPGICCNKRLPYVARQTALRVITAQEQSTMQFYDWLLDAVSIDLYEVMRHFVIRIRDGLPAYQIVSLVGRCYSWH